MSMVAEARHILVDSLRSELGVGPLIVFRDLSQSGCAELYIRNTELICEFCRDLYVHLMNVKF